MNETAGRHNQDFVRSFDQRDWDPGTERTLFGHQYRQRVRAIANAVRRHAPGRRLADLGAAQGNIAIHLARLGYAVTAVERNQAFIDYARAKRDSERVEWKCADLRSFTAEEPYDAVVLGEVIEHTGTPERLLVTVAKLLRPGGMLVLTTPNGERIREHLASFTAWRAAQSSVPEWVQFGPAGEDHQFLYTRDELAAVLFSAFDVVGIEAVGSAAWNRLSAKLLKLPGADRAGDAVEAAAMRLDFVSRRIANHWLVVARRR
jgi:2-polyprenyl-3-methyl-5-hydroxy-6-metoxy-1,4-benzoquinol methylase